MHILILLRMRRPTTLFSMALKWGALRYLHVLSGALTCYYLGASLCLHGDVTKAKDNCVVVLCASIS